MYLGDFAVNSTVHFMWNTFTSVGASVTRATNGTISVYKNNGTIQTTVGVTDTEDFDGLTGVHAVAIATTDAFYGVGNYTVALSGATIDGQLVNAALAHFSIENRDNALDRVDAIEVGVTLRGVIRLMASVLVGKLSGAGTGTETFRNAKQDSKARVTATVDASGNRTAITTDVT